MLLGNKAWLLKAFPSGFTEGSSKWSRADEVMIRIQAHWPTVKDVPLVTEHDGGKGRIEPFRTILEFPPVLPATDLPNLDVHRSR